MPDLGWLFSIRNLFSFTQRTVDFRHSIQKKEIYTEDLSKVIGEGGGANKNTPQEKLLMLKLIVMNLMINEYCFFTEKKKKKRSFDLSQVQHSKQQRLQQINV